MKKLLAIAILSVLLVSCNQNKLAEAESRIQQLEAEKQELADKNQQLETRILELENESKLAQIKIGNTYEGGIIFYVDETGQHGKVCSPQDLGKFKWEDAKKQCEDLIEGGYDDWYLPSKEELNQMYTNLHKNALGGFDYDFYWSSTENVDGVAWVQIFDSGLVGGSGKGTNGHVRAVRAF